MALPKKGISSLSCSPQRGGGGSAVVGRKLGVHVTGERVKGLEIAKC